MASTRLGYLMIKRETTPALAVKPTRPVRFKDGQVMLKQEIIANNPIQNNRWLALNSVPGKISSDGSYNVDLDANECVHFLAAALGSISSADVGSTADGTVFTHTLTVANTLPTFTLEQGKGNLTDTTNNRQNYQVDRAFGCVVDTFTISASDSIAMMEVGIKTAGIFQMSRLISNASAGSSVALALTSSEGLVATDVLNVYDTTPKNESATVSTVSIANSTATVATLAQSYTVANSAKVELIPQTPSYSVPAQVLSFFHARFRFGSDLTAAASATPENVEDWSLEYSNDVEERYGSLRAAPSVIAPKGAKCTLKFSKYFETITDRDRYLNQTPRACILTIQNPTAVVSATDTTLKKYTVQIELSDVRYTSYEMPTGTNDLYAISAEMECYYSTTDGRAMRVLVTNSQAGTIYTT